MKHPNNRPDWTPGRRYPIRLQVATYHRLTAEVIVEDGDTAALVFARLATLKWQRGLPMGGALRQRADLPRWWDVPVGAPIPHEE